jgi:hypothetical protein
MEAAQFRSDLIEAVPERIHTAFTDNGLRFTTRQQDVHDSQDIFDPVRDEQDIDHRLTKVNQSLANGQGERMNRTIEDTTVKRIHYDSHAQLRAHPHLSVGAYNHARGLQILRDLTRTGFILNAWTKEFDRSRIDP